MELSVLVGELERCVSGVNEKTTVAQIIHVLCHATGQKGKFVLIEKFRNTERRLAATDKPLESLQKWKDHAHSVTYIMKKVNDDGQLEPIYDTIDSSSSVPSLLSFRNTSNSSVTSMQPQGSANHSLGSSLRSTSSLPPAVASPNVSLRKYRPPPPDYKTAMELKYASMTRNQASKKPTGSTISGFNSSASTSTNIPNKQNLNVNDIPDNIPIGSLGLSPHQLLQIIEEQREVIENQKMNLRKLDSLMTSPEQRELLQLFRQQANLRAILKPLAEQNWPQKYQQEFKRSHALRAAIEATKEAIDKTKSDVTRLQIEEERLLNEISNFDAEEILLETSIDLNLSSTPNGNNSHHSLQAY
ncbi:hypothetical protein WR25_26263 [Diploscapter pachys]|uniref:Ras association domain-containing protein n=1 Tax=Diploscapter pachys TaxID=2018661 RepID=A0A2A2JSN3_9BILA|nr:hypothetical protein WR25_26263 [Diploscapter pachys]